MILDDARDLLVAHKPLQEFSEEMKKTELDWKLISYAQTYHFFTVKTANQADVKQHNEKSSKRAFQSMYELLEDVFQ
ncbi:dienelactone hydrolase family protein [Acinetobacter sp. ANC 5383]